MVGIAIMVAALIAVPMAMAVYRYHFMRQPVLSLASILQTVPGLAMLAFFVPILGIGKNTALITLVLYALFPIVRGSYTGLRQTSPDMQEAARGMGMTEWQKMRWVELPLAIPSIINGIRIASVMTMGMATLAAFIGAGGLGDFINQGLAMNDNRLILCGALPAACLALVSEGLLGRFERMLQPGVSSSKKARWTMGIGGVSALFLLTSMLYLPLQGNNTIIIGSKKFEEQYILADLLRIMIDNNTGLTAQTRLNLGTTAMAHQALVRGDIDMYPEYTGTAYQLILNQQNQNDNQDLLTTLRHSYHKRFGLAWLDPFPFENKQVLAITQDFAKNNNIKNISDLARSNIALSIAAPAEFLHRADAYKTLLKHYNLDFANVRQMEPGLAYQAINKDEVNVIMAFSTDGRLPLYHLTTLEDDHHAFPRYQAAPVVRESTLEAHPQLRPVIKRLSPVLTVDNIRRLNYRVTVEHQPPHNVAYNFLQRQGLI